MLKKFPTIKFAFQYGSSYLKQAGYAAATGGQQGQMLDLMFVVDDPVDWHRQNMERHGDHYSWTVRYLLGGARAAACIQEWGTAGVYFNPMVTMDNDEKAAGPVLVKYGVVSTDRFTDDLTNWSSLYVAGRLHKPVGFLTDVCRPITSLLDQNLRTAVRVARLLMLPDETRPLTAVPLDQLFLTIAGLSYQGDVRMGVAENPDKVSNIVSPNLDQFTAIYREHIDVVSTEPRDHLIGQLPPTLKAAAGRAAGNTTAAMADSLRTLLSTIVRQSSRDQSLKGLVTAGPLKSISYVSQKIRKKIRA